MLNRILTLLLISPMCLVGVTLPHEELEPLIKDYCFKCHGPEKEKGDVRFDRASLDLESEEVREFWRDVLISVEDGDMPPEDEPQPKDSTVSRFVHTLSTYLELAEPEPKVAEASEAVSPSAAGIHLDKKTLGPFLQSYCIDCHGPRKDKGDVRVDELGWTISDVDQAQRWQDVLDVLNGGDMPPKGEPQPRRSEMVETLNSLTTSLQLAEKRLSDHGGKVTMRRLNRREYVNTIQHLFGFPIAEYMIPEDSESEEFDTVGAHQFFGALQFDRYLTLGKEVAMEGFNWSSRSFGAPKSVRHQAEVRRRIQISDEYLVNDGLILYRPNQNVDTYDVSIKADPRAYYKVKVRAGATPNTLPVRHNMVVRSSTGIKSMMVHGTIEKPSVIDFTTSFPMFSRGQQLSFTEDGPYLGKFLGPYKQYMKALGEKNTQGAIWIDWVEVDGPYYHNKTSVLSELLASSGKDLYGVADAKSFIEQFAYEAFRREQPSSLYVLKLHGYFKSLIEEGMAYEEAMSEVISIILTSPQFLYIEEEKEKRMRHRLSTVSFVNRLSYFLWSAPPDKELYELALNDRIYDIPVIKQQIHRMLQDPRSDAFYTGFMEQWADLERFDGVSVDGSISKHLFHVGLRHSARREPIEFFKALAQENLPLENLINSDFIVATPQLAAYYGLPVPQKNGFHKIQLPADSPRGGLMTQAAFLVSGSNGERSSPVIRGTMILDKLLNSPPPPPPPNVPELGSKAKGPLSNREMVKMHQEQLVCASCHSKIDPIGFGLEHFDEIGRYRMTELVGDKQVPIVSGGKLASGHHYRDVTHLKQLLLSQKDKLGKEVIESLLEYGLGRTMEFSDREKIQGVLAKSKKHNYSVENVIFDVITSPLFTVK